MDFDLALRHRDEVEPFRQKHRVGLLTLLFTDVVDPIYEVAQHASVILICNHGELSRLHAR